MPKLCESVTTIVALGLLAEGPLHGHEIRQRFAERGIGTFTELTVGALYHGLRVLEKRALIKVKQTERVGARPERTVYEITAAGQAVLKDALIQALSTLERHHFAVDAALSQSRNLSSQELEQALQARKRGQLELLVHLEATQELVAARLEQLVPADRKDRGSAIALGMSVVRRAQAHAQAELAWLDETIAALAPKQGKVKR
jgi:DNA-binding PadR family transcriptional regulator